MIDEVHAMNAKLMISVWANFGPETPQYKEFAQSGRLIPIQSYPTTVATRPYDVYDAATRNSFWNYLSQGIMSKGVDALWLDSSEPDDFSNKGTDYDYVTGLNGRTFRSLRNAFPLCHVEGVYDHHLADPTLSDKRVSILTRSAFAGMQRTGAFVWSADITSSWQTLAAQIPAACNFSVSGLPYWNSDTGAFFTGSYRGVGDPAWRTLYDRWTQFSCFCPMMRFHGDNTPREIWQFGSQDDAQGDYNNILRYIRLRYRLLPISTAPPIRWWPTMIPLCVAWRWPTRTMLSAWASPTSTCLVVPFLWPPCWCRPPCLSAEVRHSHHRQRSVVRLLDGSHPYRREKSVPHSPSGHSAPLCSCR